MANTTNFGWETPDDTDLVKDGALAIRTLGSAIDTSLVDLKGGTTGQVLSKASNTDMDFTWTAVDPLVILDAKGDLISATAADTPARLAVGTNGQVLTADSTTSTGLKWATPTSTSGLTLISSTSFSGVASQSINDVFSTTYTNYKIIIDDLIVSTGNTDLSLRLRVGGTDLSDSVYSFQILNIDGTSASASRETSQNKAYIGSVSASNKNAVSLEIFNPFTTKQTLLSSNNTTTINTIREVKISTFINNTTSYTGFTLIPATNNITGTVSVYGYNK